MTDNIISCQILAFSSGTPRIDLEGYHMNIQDCILTTHTMHVSWMCLRLLLRFLVFHVANVKIQRLNGYIMNKIAFLFIRDSWNVHFPALFPRESVNRNIIESSLASTFSKKLYLRQVLLEFIWARSIKLLSYFCHLLILYGL